MPVRGALITVCMLSLWVAAPVPAQTVGSHAGGVAPDALGGGPSEAAAAEACAYDACALRLWGGEVLEGRAQEPVARFGFLRPPRLEELLAPSDSATAHLGEVKRNYTRGRVATLAARLVSVAGIAMSFSDDSGTQRWGIGFQAAALPIGWFGRRKVTRAEEAMSRATWWYNRDVATGGPGPPR